VNTPYPTIGDYALISDCHSAALVSRDGSVDWCCFDRFDARPVFGRVLDWSRGGHFKIAVSGFYSTTRRYLPGTNILETTFETPTGKLTLTDCLAIHEMSQPDEAEAVAPYRQLVRLVRCDAGQVTVCTEFCPRFDFGLTTPQLIRVGSDLATVYGGADALLVQSDLFDEHSDLAGFTGERTMSAGERASAVVTYSRPHELRAKRLEQSTIERRVSDTRRFWIAWSKRCTYEGPYQSHVLRSALVLKGLTNAPTGAIVAAPTTSLPERIGGMRNWDYRYTWLRDASYALYALFTLGYTDEAHAFMRWLQRTTAGRADELQVVYGVGGERLLPEFELQHLDGYRGSRPVRVGNAAATQVQLDAYGEVLDTAWLFHRRGGTIDSSTWDFLMRLVGHIERTWQQPDEGIWEVRGPRQHFVYSKVMAWVAVDRGIRLARRLGMAAPLERWQALAAEIRARIDVEGVNPDTGCFVQAFGSKEVDASALLLPLRRFVKPDDPRVRATLDCIFDELTERGLVRRYRHLKDGLRRGEGTFLLCSFWLVDNLVLTGQVERGRELFEQLLEYANDVGLLSEEVDPISGELLGNFPQAFSHMGVINSAIQLQRAAA